MSPLRRSGWEPLLLGTTHLGTTLGQGGEEWEPHCPHLYGKLVLMASVAMLALRPWKLTSYSIVLAHVLHLPAGAASSKDLLSKKAGFSQRPDFPEGLLQAGFALPFLQVLVPWSGQGWPSTGARAGPCYLAVLSQGTVLCWEPLRDLCPWPEYPPCAVDHLSVGSRYGE